MVKGMVERGYEGEKNFWGKREKEILSKGGGGWKGRKETKGF